jgi:hypothetical protein
LNAVNDPLCWIFNTSSVYNNLNGGYGAAYDFGNDPGQAHILENNIAYGNGAAVFNNNGSCVENNNSWDPGYSVSSSDFVSLDTTGITGPRQPNGSLPVLNFLKLKSSSPLATGGTDLGSGLGTKMGFVYGWTPPTQ